MPALRTSRREFFILEIVNLAYVPPYPRDAPSLLAFAACECEKDARHDVCDFLPNTAGSQGGFRSPNFFLRPEVTDHTTSIARSSGQFPNPRKRVTSDVTTGPKSADYCSIEFGNPLEAIEFKYLVLALP
jgi:hypothetical protein